MKHLMITTWIILLMGSGCSIAQYEFLGPTAKKNQKTPFNPLPVVNDAPCPGDKASDGTCIEVPTPTPTPTPTPVECKKDSEGACNVDCIPSEGVACPVTPTEPPVQPPVTPDCEKDALGVCIPACQKTGTCSTDCERDGSCEPECSEDNSCVEVPFCMKDPNHPTCQPEYDCQKTNSCQQDCVINPMLASCQNDCQADNSCPVPPPVCLPGDLSCAPVAAFQNVGFGFEDGGGWTDNAGKKHHGDDDYNDMILCFEGLFNVDYASGKIVSRAVQSVETTIKRNSSISQSILIKIRDKSGSERTIYNRSDLSRSQLVNETISFEEGDELKVQFDVDYMWGALRLNLTGIAPSERVYVEADRCRTTGI